MVLEKNKNKILYGDSQALLVKENQRNPLLQAMTFHKDAEQLPHMK
jgi:hypothetical protein